MEPLTQPLKIGAAFALVAGLGLFLLPQTPSLLAGRAEIGTQGPVAESAPPPTEAAPATEPEPERVAQASTPNAGQTHLQRLREAAGRGTAAPAPEAPAAASEPPAEAPPAEPPAEEPVAEESAPIAQEEEVPVQEEAPPPTVRPRPASGPTQYRMFRSPEAVDSATLRVEGRSVHLSGISAVPATARCTNGSACGQEAREALADYLARQPVLCSLDAGDAPILAPCLSGEEDVAGWAVWNGWARAEPGSPYEMAERAAREAGRGIWGAGGL